MGINTPKQRHGGLVRYSQVESIIGDYLSKNPNYDAQAILEHIRGISSSIINKTNEVDIQSLIVARLQSEALGIKIDKLNNDNAQLVNKVLFATTELDIIYARNGVMTLSEDGTIESVNDPMLGISGFTREELVGNNISIMNSGLHSDEFFRKFHKEVRSGNVWEGEIINKGKDGNILNLWTLVIPIEDNTGKLSFRVIRRDISETKINTERLMAIQGNKIDVLTGLPAYRQIFIDFANHLPKRIAVVHLNDLGDINMAYGDLHIDSHIDIGGLLILKISKLLKKYAMEYPDLGIKIYKLSGPEFAITYETAREQEFFDRIYEKMNTLKLGNFGVVLDSGVELSIQPSFSFGVALEGADIKTFLSNAMSALAVSKGQSNRLTIYTEQNSNIKSLARENVKMKHRVRDAFLNNGFVIEFQPIIRAPIRNNILKILKKVFQKKKVEEKKYEILVRMIDPDDSNKRISPAAFLPIIEADHQNILLTTRVISLACEFMLDNPGHYSINITAQDLNMVGRAKEIMEQVGEYGINLSRFTFEILENIEFLAPVALDNINYLHKNGALIAIDDYGTGFSSVPRLRRLHAHFLKLDMSLTRGIDTNSDNRTDVRLAIKTAHKLGAEVIAEGIETMAEKRVLIELGVDHLQGYLIGKPMPHI